ncbi:Actin-like protein arp5 [Smittium mucronatum]|uniref:Actin-like protein arp5 n=1 Tax=Smittium mucronatum TaxID=133383 RepID=A0A1R0GXS0_9FUNG|nr:Actin-like protein arp5 [Smittium mucronatum]
MNELLFECYNVPSVSYGISSLWSYYYNSEDCNNLEDAIIIDSGNFSTHLIPVFEGKFQLKHAKSSMIRDHMYFAQDYRQELDDSLEKSHLEKSDHIIQFPFQFSSAPEMTEEELERQAEKKREHSKKLSEITARIRNEKLEKKELDLIEFQEILNYAETDNLSLFESKLKEYGFENKQELIAEIKKNESSIKKARDKDLGIVSVEHKETPAFDLIEIPDDQLSPEDLKEKRKQKLMKANIEARERIRAAKLEEERKKEEEINRDNELKQNNFAFWLEQIKNKRKDILDKMSQKEAIKNELSNRKSHASQLRMKSIAGLASQDSNPTQNGGSRKKKDADSDDDFGLDDSDWNIYLDISKEDFEAEDNLEAELIQVNEILLQNDPDFLLNIDENSRREIEDSLFYKYISGTQKPILENPAVPQSISSIRYGGDQLSNDIDIKSLSEFEKKKLAAEIESETLKEIKARSYQIHLNVERIRVPEILFEPMIIGVDQSGITEVIENLWKLFPVGSSAKRNVFITGCGFSKVPGLDSRLYKDLTPILPVETPLSIKLARDLSDDGWRGAAKWSRNFSSSPETKSLFESVSVTRKTYEEFGGEYLKEHLFSNLYHNQKN